MFIRFWKAYGHGAKICLLKRIFSGCKSACRLSSFSCFAIGLLCAVVGRWFRMERIIMTVPTVLVSIPGSSALRTLVYFDRQDVLPAVENGVATVLVVVAMVAGLLGALMLTESEWAFSGPRH